MSPDFSIGLLVTDDDIDAVILEGWPADVRKPRIVVFDYAGHDVPDEYVLHVSMRNSEHRIDRARGVPGRVRTRLPLPIAR